MNPALDYAENVLGVHKVSEEANKLLMDLDEFTGMVDQAIDKRRTLDDAVEARKMDLLIEERGQHADLSQAAMDKRLKERYHTDGTLRTLRNAHAAAAAEASGLELDIEVLKYRIKVKVARMEELSGYFNFLAAVKNAEPPPVLYAEAGTSGQPAAASGETTTTGEQQ